MCGNFPEVFGQPRLIGIKLTEVLVVTVSNYPGVSFYGFLVVCYILLCVSKRAIRWLELSL